MLRIQTSPVLIKQLTKNFPVIIANRGAYDKKGNLKRGRKKIPHDWRIVNYNPANIPKAWKPPDWDKKNIINYDREKILAQYIPGYELKTPEHEHVDYKENAAYAINTDTKFMEGLDQAMTITKSILVDTKLPEQIQEIAENNSIRNQDERVVNVFKHGLMFDIDPSTLHRRQRYNATKLDHFKLHSKPDRYIPLILLNLRLLCQELSGKYPNLANTILAEDLHVQASFTRSCDNILLDEFIDKYDVTDTWKINISGRPGLHALKKTALKPFAQKAQVDNTSNIDLAGIYPILPIADLGQTNIYKDECQMGVKSDFAYGNLHTLFIQNTEKLSANEMYGKMAIYLFTNLYSRAKAKYGDENVEFEPLVAQCIASDGQFYQFMTMQLNTLDISNDKGVKNMIWIENPDPESLPVIPEVHIRHKSVPYEELRKYKRPDHIRKFQIERAQKYYALPMYSACSHRLWQHPEYYSDYDPRVFKLFLGMWLNGSK